MNTVMREEKLKELFDRITREDTEMTAGILLTAADRGPEEGVYTVYIGFQRGFHSSLSLRADTAILTRLTQSMLRMEDVTPLDIEDVCKEYCNVLCGHIAKALYQTTGVSSRFGLPTFCQGSVTPEGLVEQFALNYRDDRGDFFQLVHFIPGPNERIQSDGAADDL